MASRDEKIHLIIHAASLSAAGVGGGLAQIPGSDMPVIMGLQTAMIIAIGNEYGATVTETAAADLLLTFAAGMGGRFLSQLLVGWVPGLGNFINASTAATITEAIGWAANAYFSSEGGDETGAKNTKK
jgi:uncharacterized protein (DUF697 family)